MNSAPKRHVAPPHARVIVGGWQLNAGHHNGFDRELALRTLIDYAAVGMTTLDMGDIYTGVHSRSWSASRPAAATRRCPWRRFTPS